MILENIYLKRYDCMLVYFLCQDEKVIFFIKILWYAKSIKNKRNCLEEEGYILEIRCAKTEDYERIRQFYYELTDAMQDAEFQPGWQRDIYPTQEFLQESIRDGEFYIGELDGVLAAGMVVNHKYNEGYEQIHWSVQVPDEQLLVIHALGVHPDFTGRGLAKEMARYVIAMAPEQGIRTIRLDVLGGNLPASKAYLAVGLRYVNTIQMFYADTGWTDYEGYELILP